MALIAPPSLMRRFLRRAARMARRADPRRWLARLRQSTWPFRDRYIVEDNTQVTVYTARPELFTHYPSVRSLAEPPQRRVAVSVILTARNEQDTARQTIHALLRQTRRPDEIVVTETGSRDGTLAVLRALAAESPVPLRIISLEGANIARGRNAAIAQARGPVIAVTDFGCQPVEGWLASLAAPFEIDPHNEVTAGRYIIVGAGSEPAPTEFTPTSPPRRFPFWPAVEQLDPQSYLPPGGSMAFTKKAWESVGGYPEWLTLTGEDTCFDLELKRATRRWALAPEAAAGWTAPASARGWWRKASYWAAGDGEIGANARTYQRSLRQTGFLVLVPLALVGLALIALLAQSKPLVLIAAGAALLWLARLRTRSRQVGYSPILEAGIRLAMIAGYLRGFHRRTASDARRWKAARGVMVILSGVPVDDTGGGARGAQIALELVRRQYLVVYISQFPRYETSAAQVRVGHPNLLTLRLSQLRLEAFLRQFHSLLGEKPTGVLVEHPLAGFLPLVTELRQRGVCVIYDLIDAWDTSLGARWYTPEAERQMIAAADVLLATAPALQTRLELLSGREVALLPNAVNLLLFDSQRVYPRPPDMPAAEWSIIYTGALWGEWFDWGLLLETARCYPAASVVVIGDYRGQCPAALPNLHFLGLKPQVYLPAYLAHAAVAIIPWKVSEITRATSPLKVYEYLAMHKPVVAPDLPLLAGLPGVLCSPDSETFLQNIAAARRLPVGGEGLDRFLAENSWRRRVDSIIDIITE